MSLERIKDKVEEIDNYIEEFQTFIPESFNEYKNNFKIKAACERYFEKIVEALIDLAHLTIKLKRFTPAEEDVKSFDILSEKDLISRELCERLKDAKGMRNILAHEYGKVDDELVYESITTEIIKDAEDFIKSIMEKLR